MVLKKSQTNQPRLAALATLNRSAPGGHATPVLVPPRGPRILRILRPIRVVVRVRGAMNRQPPGAANFHGSVTDAGLVTHAHRVPERVRVAAPVVVVPPAVTLQQRHLQDTVDDDPRGRLRLDRRVQLAVDPRLPVDFD